jgi:hypothetical protein
MKKLILILLLLPIFVYSQTYQLNYDSIRVGKTAGTGGTSLYGKVYLKNVSARAVGDSILTVVNGRIFKVPFSGVNLWTRSGTTLSPRTANDSLNIGTGIYKGHGAKSDASDGFLIEASNGTDVGRFGVANTANSSLFGGLTVAGQLSVTSNNSTVIQGTSTNSGGRVVSLLGESTLEPLAVVQKGSGMIGAFYTTDGITQVDKVLIRNNGSIYTRGQLEVGNLLVGDAADSVMVHRASDLTVRRVPTTGTGNAVFSASPTLTGEVTVSSATIPLRLNRTAAGGALFPFQISGVDKSFLEWNVNDGGSGAGTAMNLRNNQGAVGLYDSTNTGLKISSGSGVFAGSSTAAAFIPSGSTVPTNGMYLSAANTLNFATNSTNRLSISSAGASTFNQKITVKSGNGDQLLLDNAGERFTQMDYFNNGSGKAVTYWDNTNNWFQIITTPASSAVRVVSGTNGVELANGGTSWSAISDFRQKKIIRPITDALTIIKDFRTVIGRYNTDSTNVERSFLIAQDVRKTYPYAVTVGNDEDKTLRLSYTELIPLLVKAIQELEAKVKVLENK